MEEKSKRASKHLCEEAAQHFAHVGQSLLSHVLEPNGGVFEEGRIKRNLTVFDYFVGWERKVFTGTSSYDPGEILNDLHRACGWSVTKHN